jgi:hypothetical protein
VQKPSCRRVELKLQHEQSVTDWIKPDEIDRFSAVCYSFQDHLLDYLKDWKKKMHDEYLYLYFVNFDSVPYVSSCVKILHDLSISFHVNVVCEHESRLVWVLGAGRKLQQWSLLENLLGHYKAPRNSVS